MSEKKDRPWRLPRGRHGLPRELVQQSQRERLLSAMVRVSAKKGYEATSVADILEVSGVGRETFYELFEDKQSCFLAAHRLLFEDFLAHVTEAYERPGPWPERVRIGLAALLEWLAVDPDAARVLVVEVGTVGPASRELFAETFTRVAALLDEGREESEQARVLGNVSSIAGGAVFARIYEEIVLDRTAQLPQLLPQLTYQLLLPFLGEEAAREEQRRAAA
jgi:AcrR family transcriptional regulator